jgi:hypothetical protein
MMSAINAGISAISLGGDQTPQFESPSVDDVLKVKDIIKESSRLPLEIIDCIIDFAEYWPRNSTMTKRPVIARGTITRARPSPAENVFLVSNLSAVPYYIL